jgi:hypothetical protein
LGRVLAEHAELLDFPEDVAEKVGRNRRTLHLSIPPTHYTLAAHWLHTQNRLKLYAIFTLKAIFGKKVQRLKKKNPCN